MIWILALSLLPVGVCHAIGMAVKKKVGYQKAALKRTRAATLKANAGVKLVRKQEAVYLPPAPTRKVAKG